MSYIDSTGCHLHPTLPLNGNSVLDRIPWDYCHPRCDTLRRGILLTDPGDAWPFRYVGLADLLYPLNHRLTAHSLAVFTLFFCVSSLLDDIFTACPCAAVTMRHCLRVHLIFRLWQSQCCTCALLVSCLRMRHHRQRASPTVIDTDACIAHTAVVVLATNSLRTVCSCASTIQWACSAWAWLNWFLDLCLSS